MGVAIAPGLGGRAADTPCTDEMGLSIVIDWNLALPLTGFGDLAVLLPITIAIFAWLAFLPARRHAAWWAIAVAVCMGGTAFLKILFFICPPVEDLHSPSGHASLSTLVYGGLAVLAARRSDGWRRSAIIGAGVAFALAIAASRVVLSSHTLIETVLGVAVGAAALAVFARSYFSERPADVPLRPLALGVAVLIVLLHGQQLHAEDLLRAVGFYLRADGIACQ